MLKEYLKEAKEIHLEQTSTWGIDFETSISKKDVNRNLKKGKEFEVISFEDNILKIKVKLSEEAQKSLDAIKKENLIIEKLKKTLVDDPSIPGDLLGKYSFEIDNKNNIIYIEHMTDSDIEQLQDKFPKEIEQYKIKHRIVFDEVKSLLKLFE